MHKYYITFRSVTYAQRGERVLQKEGIRCRLLRTPKWMEERGCGYCLELRREDIHSALSALQTNQVALRKVYRQGREGQLEECDL